jgi:hypothetical protein
MLPVGNDGAPRLAYGMESEDLVCLAWEPP